MRTHAWNAKEKTALIREGSYLGNTQHAALMILSTIVKVIGFLVVDFLASVAAASTTFFTQNLAVGSTRSANLWPWLRADTYVHTVAQASPVVTMYATNMATGWVRVANGLSCQTYPCETVGKPAKPCRTSF